MNITCASLAGCVVSFAPHRLANGFVVVLLACGAAVVLLACGPTLAMLAGAHDTAPRLVSTASNSASFGHNPAVMGQSLHVP
jgi:hypothetical protein